MFAITVQEGEPVALCYSDWEREPHTGSLQVCLSLTCKVCFSFADGMLGLLLLYCLACYSDVWEPLLWVS